MKRSALIVTILALTASTVLADPIMFYNGLGYNSTVKVYAPGLLANNLTVNAGQMKITYNQDNFLAYCVDLNQYAGNGAAAPVSVATLNHGAEIAYLFDTYANSVDSNVKAAALAVSIWEVLTETGDTFDVLHGDFRISNNASVATAAGLMLSTVPVSYTPTGWPTVLHGDCVQDMLIATVVPEPATLSVLALGGLCLLRRRR
jgi:hypothetical protein